MDLFTTDLFTKGILPFLLVFVLIFALLQKSKIFGEGKSQIDALISLAIALILIGIPQPRDIIVNMVPWLAVALVVLFIVLVIYGFGGEYDADPKKGLKIPKWFSKTVLVLAILFVVILVLSVTDGWTYIKGWIDDSSVFSNILLLVVIAGAMWIALRNSSEDGK
ncbi:MAG: hypothetical protein WCI72_06225 [archaeon]